MRFLFAALCLSAGISVAQGATLTLEAAWRLAEEANPELAATRASVLAAEGEAREGSRLLYNNPELSFEASRREAPTDLGTTRFRESAVGIAQTIEVGGQRGHRQTATQRELEAARAQVEEARARVRGEVEEQFFRVLALQRRVTDEEESAKLAEDAAAAAARRVSAGEDSKLDGNLARVEAERARNQAMSAAEHLVEARAKLAASLQLPADRMPEAVGDISQSRPGYTLSQLLESAALRPQLLALEHREEAARSRLALERAAVVPDVTVGLSTAREGPPEARERVATLSVSIPLPLWKQNDAAIGRASADLAKVQTERRAGVRAAEADVRALWSRLQSSETRMKRLSESVVARLDENRSLSSKAYGAGEIGIVQLVLVNRQVLEARREWLDSVVDFIQTRVALEQAAGWTAKSLRAANNPPAR